MDEKQLVNTWLSVFGEAVNKKIMNNHVLECGNLMWHIFTWGKAECLKGEPAKRAFDELKYEKAVKFYNGQAGADNFPQIEDASTVGKITSGELDNENDVYIVSSDFSWTYVHTHEEMCGPYFVKKEM